MERSGGVGIILSSQSLKVREHHLRDQSKNWRLLNWTVKKQEMVQRVAGSYKTQWQTLWSHNRKRILGQLHNCQLFKGTLLSGVRQWLDTYHKLDTVSVYNIQISWQATTGYFHWVFRRTVKFIRIWMFNAAWKHFHSWKKNTESSVWLFTTVQYILRYHNYGRMVKMKKISQLHI